MAEPIRPAHANSAFSHPLMVADVKPDYPSAWRPGEPYRVKLLLNRSFDAEELRLFEEGELRGFGYDTDYTGAFLFTDRVEIHNLDSAFIKEYLADLSSTAVVRRRQAEEAKREQLEHFQRAYTVFRPDA